MGLKKTQRSEEEWIKVIEAYEQSGMSLRAYSEETGINLKTLSNHTRSNTSIKSRRRRNLDEWRELIQEQIASGLSLSIWCREKGISATAMRDAERKIKTDEGQKSQNWAKVQVETETKIIGLTEGCLRIRLSDIEIEVTESYPAENIVALILGLRKS